MDQHHHGPTFDEIRAVLEPYNSGAVELTGDTRLNSDLNIDSVAAMDLIMEIEDRFEIDIPMNLVSDVETLQDLVQLVSQRMED